MNFDQMMIHHCAPTFCEIKAANMFFIKKDTFSVQTFNYWKELFDSRGFMTFAIPLSNSLMGILVCNSCWTKKILEDALVQEYLFSKEYHCCKVNEFVNIFSERVHERTTFPHEIGIILGYPVADVIAFENNKGSDCKYCGQWKSYSDVEKAKECHCRYINCCCLCDRLYSEGYSLDSIICKYKNDFNLFF